MKIKIKSKKLKGKFIYGNSTENKKTATLVVFMSGLSGGMGFPLFKNASVKFLKNGFSAVEFNFCNDSSNKRQKINAPTLEQMSFSVYTAELKNILDSYGKKYSKIVLIGHSFGAIISILFLSKYKKYVKNTELVLWDPSLLPWKKEWMEQDFVFDAKKRLYIGKNGKEVMNKLFYKECINIKNTANILQSLNKKVCIATAENGAHKDAKKYFLKIHNKKSSRFIIIKKTGHLFTEKIAQKELFKETIDFLNR
ncbi:MAG: hypothetical protein HZB09_01890 [Candidatus Yonathbacteria bacterium]|nr:hypothetical protein [Candidatus Yonathbacteria bacterium]